MLLVLRGPNGAEPNKWALPGGFINGEGRRGEPWRATNESPLQAAVREAEEETGFRSTLAPLFVGTYEGGGRDPRDTPTSWTRSHAFVLDIGEIRERVEGRDDAARAEWVPLNKLPTLAFDHAEVVSDGLALLGIEAPKQFDQAKAANKVARTRAMESVGSFA
jgi:8-oxo-dGTP diphosphatase